MLYSDVVYEENKIVVYNKKLLNRSSYGKLSFDRNMRMISIKNTNISLIKKKKKLYIIYMLKLVYR